MTEIKEVNALGTIASIRKATQESLKPVIEEIQRKMVALNLETTQIASKVDKIGAIQKRQGRLEETIHYMQSQILELKEQSQSLQLQQTIDKAERQRLLEENRQQIQKLTKEKEKQASLLQTMVFQQLRQKERNERVSKQLSKALQSMKAREQALEIRFKTLSERSENLGFDIKANSEKLAAEFQQIRSTLSHELKQNSRRLSLLDMFEAEKDITAKKIEQISINLQNKVSTDQYDFFKDCIGKEQQRVVDSVKKIIQDNLSQKTRDLLICLPQMRDQILYCLTHDQRIAQVSKKIDDIRIKFSEDHNQALSDQNKFKTTVFDRFVSLQEERVEMSNKIFKALSFEGAMIERLDEYSEKLKEQLRKQNYKKSRELYEEIKETFADKKQELRQRQFQRIIEERQRLFDRAKEMENLASKIGEILTNFSTRITKVKSDNQMFVQKVKKQLLVIDQLRRMIVNNTDLIGETLSQIMQTVLINNCIEIEEQSKNDQEIAFSTHQDGVIYQKYLAHSKNTDSGVIVYRRKSMNTKYLKRALVASITQIYDKLMDQDNCLCWKDHSPSLFFRQHIEPTYQNLLQNHSIEEKNRKTVQSSMNHRETLTHRETPASLEPFDSINRKTPSTQRSRRTRYEEKSIFFTKSSRRVRGSLSNTIALD